MTENQYNQNQTQFVAEEPILAQPVPVVPDPTALVPPPVKPQPKRLWLVMSLVGILLLIVLIALFRRSNTPAPADETTQPVEEQRPLTPLELRLQTARDLLRKANPTTQELPFPPIDMTLRIDDP